MELPADVLIHNELLGMRGKSGSLLGVHAKGYYELRVEFGDSQHRMMMPIATTVLIVSEAEEDFGNGVEVER